jgi:Mg2+ and Co2+ transporter CorA
LGFVNVRAVEWRPADGSGWAWAVPEQWGSHTVSLSPVAEQTISSPADLKAVLPKNHAFVGDGNDQFTIVFGDVWGMAQGDEMADWWAAIFPQLQNPYEVAEAMDEWDSTKRVMAIFPDRAWNLFRLCLAVPFTKDCNEINAWAFAHVIVLGRALLVFWFGDSDAHIKTSSEVDARARRGCYTGDPPSGPIAELASAYAVEAVRAIRESATEAIKDVEQWESGLFESAEEPFRRAENSNQITELGIFKYWAFGLRETIDGIAEQVDIGQFRASWSTEEHDPVADSVDRELDAARAAVARFRSDVADAFEAANTVAIARQLAASQEQRERADRLEGTVTRLTAFLLVPTLVAAVFGANVELPGDGWVRTAIMLFAMVAGSLATFFVLRRWERRT